MSLTTKPLLSPIPARRPPDLGVDRLTIHYGRHTVLRQASLQVGSGQLMALVGPSGCGKSSLLSCINRMSDLVPGCRVEGGVTLDGADIRAGMPVDALRRRVGMVFQQPNPFPLSIEDNITFPLRENGMRDPRHLRQRLERVLVEVGLWDEVASRLGMRATDLSGGQQQRLCIARALALEPDVLLLDEPCSALDPHASATVERLIGRLKGRHTILMVTHNLAQARRLADRIAVCWVRDGCGCVVESGASADIFERPGDPVTRAYCLGQLG